MKYAEKHGIISVKAMLESMLEVLRIIMEVRTMSKKLTAFFSASGVTKRVAETIAAVSGADLFEIVPEKLYTKADLDWQDDKSRSSVEMKNKTIRPAIAADCKVSNMADYDTVLIGFPIWWYVAPTIINTFLEQYDFSGKKIVLFATSGSSGMGKTAEELKPSAPGAVFSGEKRLPANVLETEIKAWLDSLNIL